MKSSKALRHALADYVDVVTLGSARTDTLRERLREIHDRNTRYFLVPVVMLVVTFVVAMGLIIYGAVQASGATTVAAIFGVSIVGMIRLMMSFWREKATTEVLIELSELDEAVLRQMAARLLGRMK